jgi:DNA replication protein DnaC
MHGLTEDEFTEAIGREIAANVSRTPRASQSSGTQISHREGGGTGGSTPTLPQPSANGYRDAGWHTRERLPWELYPSADAPRVSVVKVGPERRKIEYRWWVDKCPEVDNPNDECPGYILEHRGPGGEWLHRRECPYHGMRWVRSYMTEAEVRDDLQARVAAAQIPDQFHAWTFYNFPDRDGTVWAQAMEYASAGKLTGSLMLTGTYGTGKTSIAVSILKKRIHEHGGRGLFVVVPALFAEIRASFDGKGDSSLLQRVTNVALLVLDDLGAERPTEWVQEQLYHILNTRLVNGRPTIVTTNLSVGELQDRLGQRTMERVKAYRIIEVGGRNMRNKR